MPNDCNNKKYGKLRMQTYVFNKTFSALQRGWL